MNDNEHARPADDDGRLAAVLLDLDRCSHGRHSLDPCGSCGGQSQGNPTMPPGKPIGFDRYGKRIWAPAPEDRHNPKAWRRPPANPAAADDPDMTALYRERAHLVALLASTHPSILVPADDYPGWGIVYVNTPAGQMSWHIAPADLDLFAGVCAVGERYAWDGHTTEEKYRRMRTLALAGAAPDADVESAAAWRRLAERVNGGPLPTDVIEDLAQYNGGDR